MRTIAIADVHLVSHTPEHVSLDLADLIQQHQGARLIVVGDLFDLASETPKRPLERAISDVLHRHHSLRLALGRHLETGGHLWMCAGNHDAEVAGGLFRNALTSALSLGPEAQSRLRTTPWFFREGALHIEHGHIYDPDNAPDHPLVFESNTLGKHFVEQFLAPTGAYRYLNVNDQTPLSLFLSSFRWYGTRAPYVIYRYFYTAISAMARSGPFYSGEALIGEGREKAIQFAEQFGIAPELCESVFSASATPTMKSLARTFSRLYFDRVLATIAISAGLGTALSGRPQKGALIASLGAILMGTSWALGHNRYGGNVTEHLSGGAERIAQNTGAKLVIFGHTHREGQGPGYSNTASFAFTRQGPGRPYLEIEGSPEFPRAERKYLISASPNPIS